MISFSRVVDIVLYLFCGVSSMKKSALFILCVLNFNAIALIDRLSYNLVQGLPNIYITPQTERIGHTWVNGNVWEKPLIRKFYDLLAARNEPLVVMDIGAQTGCFSLLAKFLPHTTWYSFDALEHAANALKDNVYINDIDNVHVHHVALSDFSGQVTLKLPEMNAWGLATIGDNPLRFDPIYQTVVDCIKLDDFVKDNAINKVHFMKLDTEGAELSILRGAQEMIKRDHPIILMEYNETNMKQCGVTKDQVNAFLIQMGYQWELVSSEDILCIPIDS